MSDDDERKAVEELGERIGYGRVMQLCETLWRAKPQGQGALTVGPAAGSLVKCGCQTKHLRAEDGRCAWCCGSGKITKRVREAQREAG